MENRCSLGRLMRSGLVMFILAVTWLVFSTQAAAAEPLNEPLDSQNPVYFYGDTISYKNQTISLGEKAIYIDGSLSDAICDQYTYVYNDFVKAYKSGAIKSGTAEEPMKVYLAPYVYWIDDPDDPEIRQGVNGDNVPYGLWMDCSYLSLNGLTENPDNVVFAVNRGHNAGATGNYTMFYINGTGTHTENLTFGNYCCVDLEYPLLPSLSREKRQTAITQSQLILTNGSKITAENCNFISRLNSCPFVGGSRILFQDCHFECTDDSLPTGAVYVGCDFEFYSSKPFYNTTGTGSVMLGCTFNIMHGSAQYLTKVGGAVAIIDGTFNSTRKDQYIGWTADPATSLRCYSGNITVNYSYTDENGETQQETVTDYQMDADQPYDNVNITGKAALDAYRVEYNGQIIYNVYNLMKGTDGYDPLGQKALLEQASTAAGKDYTNVSTAMSCTPATSTVSHGNSLDVSTYIRGFTTTGTLQGKITWMVEDKLKNYITLKDNGDGTCTLTCKNEELVVVEGMVYAYEESGLSAGVYVTAAPETQPAPTFLSTPVFSAITNGNISLNYTLSNAEVLPDYSEILWYRCSDAKGEEYVMTAVSAENRPLQTYTLGYGDVGYYIKAVISPKQLCTYAGDEVTVISSEPIKLSDVTASPFVFSTDFSDFAYDRQKQIIPGFWVRDVYKAWLAAEERETNLTGWSYGLGAVGYGSENLYGLLPTERGARLLYTPPKGTYGDMNLTLVVNPEKNAGQGFGSAGQYMDIFIKFDTTTLTGYALRLERIGTLDCGVQVALVEYNNDTVTYISDKVTTSAFNAECTITLSIQDGVLSTSVTTTHEQSEKQIAAELQTSVELTAQVANNTYGGAGILLTGTAPVGNRVMFNSLEINWNGEEANLEEPTPVKLGEEDESEPSEETKLKKGSTFTKNNIKYKVTNNATNGKGTLMVVGITKKSLTSVKIANTVTYKGVKYKITGIGKNAFAKCGKMKKITIAATGLKTVQKNALKGIHKKCVIKVPKKQLKEYKKLLKNKGQKSTVKISK